MSAKHVIPSLLVITFLCSLFMPATTYGQIVNIPDAALKAAVMAAMGIDHDPTETDMLNLTDWGANSVGISDLTGLEYATNLTHLYLSDNQISNLSPLTGLTNLTELQLGDNTLNQAAYDVYIPQIFANNPGIVLSYDPMPFCFYSTTQISGGSAVPNSLMRIDAVTGSQVLAGPVGSVAEQYALDRDPVSGMLYGVDGTASGVLSQIDTATGVSTVVGTILEDSNPVALTGLAFAPDGTLYGLSGNLLGVIDPGGKTFTSIGWVQGDGNMSGIDFSPDGTLYGVSYISVPVFSQYLITLDKSNADILSQELITSNYNVGDIDYAPDGYIYHTNFSWWLMRIYPATANQELIGSGDQGALGGIASGPGTANAVFFADANLKAAVMTELEIDYDPTTEDMLNLMELDAIGLGITSLAGLETALNLNTLNIYNNQISDLTPLAGLANLHGLQISNNQIVDISPLVNMTQLNYLLLGSNPLSAVSYSSYLPQIIENNPGMYIEYDPNPWGDTIEGCLAAGRSALAEKTLTGLRTAYAIFDEGIQPGQFGTSNQDLVFFHACTRAMMMLFRENGETINSLFELAGEFGVRFSGELLWPLDINPYTVLNEYGFYETPAGAPDKAGIRQILVDTMIPELDAIIAEFDPIPGSFEVILTPQETGSESDVEVDHNDVTVFWAFLKAVRARLALESAYQELTMQDIDSLGIKIASGAFDIESDLLDAYPNFLLLDPDHGAERLAQAKADLLEAINDYINAKTAIEDEQNSDPDQSNDLLYLDPNTILMANSLQDKLTTLRDSINNEEPGVYPWQTTDVYELTDGEGAFELSIIYNLTGLEGHDGYFNVPVELEICPRWLVDSVEREGAELWINLDPNEYGVWGGGSIIAEISEDGQTLSNARFDFWGDYEGTILLSGLRSTTTPTNKSLDLTGIFSGAISPRDMLPLYGPQNLPIPNTMGYSLYNDATLGGVLPDMTQDDWTKQLNLQPSGDATIPVVDDWGIETEVDGDLSNWVSAGISPIFTDIEGDAENHPFMEGEFADIKDLYLAVDPVNKTIYGAVTTYERPYRDYVTTCQTVHELILSYPGEYEPLYAFWVSGDDQNPDGYAEYGNDHLIHFNAAQDGHTIEFAITIDEPSLSVPLPGRFIELNSWLLHNENTFGEGDDNDTGLKITQVGDTSVTTTVSGTVEYDSYPGGPITVQFFTDWGNPDGSIIAAKELDEPCEFPCNFTLEGIGHGISGYVRAIGPWAGKEKLTSLALPWVESNREEVSVGASPYGGIQLFMGRIYSVGPDNPGGIQAAIDQANNGDTIVLADGDYYGEGNWDLDFYGKAITVHSENGPENCIIDCEDASYHHGFIFQNGETGVSVVEGITIRNGTAPSHGDDWKLSYNGGAILCNGSNPTIKNCVFSDNRSWGSGGAIACAYGSTPRIIDCTFDYNESACGGAVSLFDGSDALFNQCLFHNNKALTGEGGGLGGAVYCAGSCPTFANCLIVGNWAEEKGGAIFNTESSPEFINCTICYNIADTYEIGQGGGLFNDLSSCPVMTNCLIGDNEDSDLEGPVELMQIRGGTPVVTYSSIQDDDENDDSIPFGGTFNNNIDDNPHFVDPDGWDGEFYMGDYHLQPDSPCINIGHNGAVRDVPLDLDGADRIVGEVVDLGAYELALPDLIVSTVDIIQDGPETFTLGYTLSNISVEGPEGISFFDAAVYFSHDAVLDETDYEFGQAYVSCSYHLSEGWNHYISYSPFAKPELAPGDYFVIVKVDAKPDLPPNYYPGVEEMNEDNNWTASPGTIFIEDTTQPPLYCITIDTQGQGSVSLNPPGSDNCYEEYTQVELFAEAQPGWAFDHWEDDLEGSTNPQTVEMHSDLNVTAVFTQLQVQTYTLTVQTVGQGTVTLNPPGGSYNENTSVQLTANPQTGWKFDHWEGDLTGTTSQRNLTMDGDKTVTAVFSLLPPPPQYTLAASVSAGQGTITVDPVKDVYNADETVTLTAHPASGWKVKGWNGTGNDSAAGQNSVVQIVMNANRQVSVEFEQITYSLTVQVSGGHGTVTMTPAGGTYPVGAVVDLSVTPATGWRITNWQGADQSPATGSLTNKVTMNTNRQVTIGTEQITGAISITIIPSVAGQAGAQWRIGGGSYHNSGDVVGSLPVGAYTVEFKSITGWTTPNSIVLDVLADQTSTGSGAYVQSEPEVVETGSLRVVLTSTSGQVDPLAKWRIAGENTWLSSGYLMADMTPGRLTIEFKPVTGWTTPANQTTQIQINQTATITGTYVPVQQEQIPATGSLTVNQAATDAAMWRLDGGAWQMTNITVNDILVGTHLVEFMVQDDTGWIAPANKSVKILQDYTTVISPEFTQVKNTVYVNPQGSGDSHMPFTLQRAIDQATPGDTIIVAAGVYSGSGNRDLDFKGKAITLRSADGPETCIIDCGGDEQEFYRGVYFHSQETAASVLDGFTITGGHASVGGGIFCSDNSNPTIKNCIIKANTCDYSGAGLRCNASSPTVIDCVITGNTAHRTGGGVFFYENSQPILTQCTIENNAADGCGGGVYCCVDSQPTLTNCLIAGNTAQTSGGGMYCAENSRVNIANCTVSGNTANLGGALRLYYAQATLTNSIIWNNTSLLAGHTINNYQSTATISHCDIESCGGSGTHWISSIGNDLGGNIDMDPAFAGAIGNTLSVGFDYHLSDMSPCIDAGDPAAACCEPAPNGGCVNQGAYGNTAEAAASVDSDNDGLLNPAEVRWGLNPLLPDTDDDGLTDYQEVALMGDTACYDPYVLTTGAGTGFNANTPDTDGDGVSDYDEAGYDFEPALYDPYSTANTGGVDMNAVSADTDGDGMPDGWEKKYPTILNPINPDDANIDSDGDGYTNLEEKLGFSDPTDPDSVPVGFRYEFEISRVRYGNTDESSLGTVSLLIEPQDGRMITAITLTRPGGESESLAVRDPALYDQNDLMGQDEVTLDAIEAAFPAGLYTLGVSFADGAEDTVTFEHWYSIYPAYVHVDQPANDQNHVSPTAAIAWSEAKVSKLQVIDTAIEQAVLSCQILSGTSSYAIPTGTLDLNRDYTLLAVNDSALAPYLASTTVVQFDTDEQKTIIYVDAQATGNENGSSWENAYPTLAPVLYQLSLREDLEAGTEIHIAQGVYAPDEGLFFSQEFPPDFDYRKLSFPLVPGVIIKGSYAGLGDEDPDARSMQDTPTVLSGVLSITTGTAYHVVTGADNAVLDGVIITDGNSTNALDDCCGQNLGGGLQCSGTSPTLSNCVLTNNHAEYGGGVYCDSGNPTLVNCVLANNTASYGAGVFAVDGTVKLINCTMADNQASDFGGGLLGWNSSIQMVNTILWDNSAKSGSEIALVENTHLYAANNCVKGGSEAIYREAGCTLSWTDTNIVRNPQFMVNDVIAFSEKSEMSYLNPLMHYQLSDSSPCIDAGDNTAITDYAGDILGQPRRYDDLVVDMGAMEFQGERVMPAITELSLSMIDVKSARTAGIGSVTINGPITLDRELVENAEFIYVKVGPYELEFDVDQAKARWIRQQVTLTYQLSRTSKVTLMLDFNKQSFSLALTNVDLGGLACPVAVTVEIGEDFLAQGLADEALIKEIGKSLPMQLLNGYADALRVDKWNLKQNDSLEHRDLLKVSGAIAMKYPATDLSQHDLHIHWGDDYSLTLPAGTINRKGKTNCFIYKKPRDLNHPVVSAMINLDQCTFAITINKADIPDQALPLTFGLSFADFNEEATVN